MFDLFYRGIAFVGFNGAIISEHTRRPPPRLLLMIWDTENCVVIFGRCGGRMNEEN